MSSCTTARRRRARHLARGFIHGCHRRGYGRCGDNHVLTLTLTLAITHRLKLLIFILAVHFITNALCLVALVFILILPILGIVNTAIVILLALDTIDVSAGPTTSHYLYHTQNDKEEKYFPFGSTHKGCSVYIQPYMHVPTISVTAHPYIPDNI